MRYATSCIRGLVLFLSCVAAVANVCAEAAKSASKPESAAVYGKSIQEVYAKLFELMDLDRPDLKEVKAKVAAKDLSGAMVAYRTALAERFSKIPTPRQSYWLFIPADADKQLEGFIVTHRYGDTATTYSIPAGKPGHMDFFKGIPEYNLSIRDISTMQWINKYTEAYAKTKDVKYLKAWCETWNDFNLHWDSQWAAVKNNPEIYGKGPDGWQKVPGIVWAEGQTLYLCWRMGAQFSGLVANLQNAKKQGQLDQLDAECIARLIVRMLQYEVPRTRNALKGAERAAPNQVRGLAMAALDTGLCFPEFKETYSMCHEAIPVSLFSYLYDGSDREQSLNYFNNVIPGLIKKIQEYMPPQEQDSALIAKLNTMSAYRDRVIPSLVRPDGITPATGSDPIWITYGMKKKLAPPSTAFTSIFFPYGGYAVQRDGWTPESLYLFMKVDRPNNGHWRPIDGGLQLSAYGTNLLVSPIGNLYDAREGFWRLYWEHAVSQNTICVDGMSAAEHKGDFGKLDQTRWLASQRFDFMETEIAGPFDGCDFRANGRSFQEKRKSGQLKDKPAVKDVVFRRQVHFLRNAACWIVTDRLNSKETHDYSQTWNFGPEFAENQVAGDKAKKSVVTSRPDAINLSLFQFGAPALDYQKYYGVNTNERIAGWVGILKDKTKWEYTPAPSVHANWQGKGEQLLVTLLLPHRGVDAKLKSEIDKTAGGIAGFDAVLGDDTKIYYRASSTPALLEAGGVKAEAASLLVTTDAGGKKSGVVLNARTFEGKSCGQANFMFEGMTAEQPWKTTPVLVPSGFRWTGEKNTLAPDYSANGW